jgi:hypothetical protein
MPARPPAGRREEPELVAPAITTPPTYWVTIVHAHRRGSAISHVPGSLREWRCTSDAPCAGGPTLWQYQNLQPVERPTTSQRAFTWVSRNRKRAAASRGSVVGHGPRLGQCTNCLFPTSVVHHASDPVNTGGVLAGRGHPRRAPPHALAQKSIAVRASSLFRVGTVDGNGWRACRLIQQADGYADQLLGNGGGADPSDEPGGLSTDIR